MNQASETQSPADALVEALQLQAHPEGGYFAETYRAAEHIASNALPSRYGGARNMGTSIYFLLKGHQKSALHQLKGDEVWYYHCGCPLTIYGIDQAGELHTWLLGPNVTQGERLQHVVPAGMWFGAQLNDVKGYTLVGCAMQPGFDFDDFTMGQKALLLEEYPQHTAIIERLAL